MVQIILGFIIILLGFYVFKFYPFEKGNVNYLVMAAIFVILTAICKRLSIMIPLLGSESFKIGIEYIPLMLAGYFLSPSYAFLVGLSSDIIGLLIVPTGFPFLGFTLGTILVSVIPSLVKEYTGKINAKVIQRIAIALIIGLGVGAAVYIGLLDQAAIAKMNIVMSRQLQYLLIIACLALSALCVGLILFTKKWVHYESKSFSTWMLCVILVHIVVTLCLTPLWLDMMYEIPFVVSMSLRIVKLCIVLPIDIFIGYTLITVLERILKYTKKS